MHYCESHPWVAMHVARKVSASLSSALARGGLCNQRPMRRGQVASGGGLQCVRLDGSKR